MHCVDWFFIVPLIDSQMAEDLDEWETKNEKDHFNSGKNHRLLSAELKKY